MIQHKSNLTKCAVVFATLFSQAFTAAVEPSTQPLAKQISGVLIDSDGRPAPSIQVVAIAEGCSEDVIDGRVAIDADAQASTTDEHGRFTFGPTTRPISSILAVTPVGRAWVKTGDLRATTEALQIVPYSYVEGIVRIRGSVAAGAAVKSCCWPTDGGSLDEQHGLFATTVIADARGHFRLPVVGGTDAVVGRVQGIGFAADIPRYVQVRTPSKTTITLDVGGGGRLVNFAVRAPDGFTLDRGQASLVPDVPKIDPAEPEWPAESVKWDKARQQAFSDAWKKSDVGKMAQVKRDAKYRDRNSKNYYGSFLANGQVRLEDVLPGNYFLVCSAHGIDGSGKSRALNYNQSVTIMPPSPDWPDSPMHLGDIEAGLLKRLYPNDAAPDFDFAGLDGGRVRLTDYRGKIVLVHFWATWCGPCRDATPDIKAIDERFVSDPRFVSIHVAEDETKAPVQRYIRAERVGGIQAWSGPSESNDVIKAYGAEAIPTMVLIDTKGRVILSTHNSGELAKAIETALKRQ